MRDTVSEADDICDLLWDSLRAAAKSNAGYTVRAFVSALDAIKLRLLCTYMNEADDIVRLMRLTAVPDETLRELVRQFNEALGSPVWQHPVGDENER